MGIQPPRLLRILINPSSVTLEVQETIQFQVMGIFTNGFTQDLTAQADFSSSNTDIVTVDDNGLATAVSVGSAEITATVDDSQLVAGFAPTAIFTATASVSVQLVNACVPTSPEHKPKQSITEKVNRLSENMQIPSVLAAAFFQMARRFVNGASPANDLEDEVFGILGDLSPEVREVMVCSLQKIDTIPPEKLNQLLAPVFTGDEPVDPTQLGMFVSDELLKRTSLETYGDEDCIAEERPGLPRITFIEPDGRVQVRPSICSVNGIRTNEFSTHPADFLPHEFQQQCQLDVNNELVCQIQPPPCPGNSVIPGLGADPICLKVPEVSPGEAVKLQGVNFFDVNAQVHIRSRSGAVPTRVVDAHVCGDIVTPVNEAGCTVQDIITFKVPEDLPPGIYGITVFQQNNTGVGTQGPSQTIVEQFIEVLPPATATFQISSVRLDVPEETDGPGSDEVGIRILATPISTDFVPGEIISNNFRFDGVDSGEFRDMLRNLFQGSNLSGVGLSIVGFEIDSEDAFKEQIQEFSDAFEQALKSSWNTIANSVGATAGAIALALGLSAAWASAIGAAISLAILVFVALWAPADLIIEDHIGLGLRDLGMLTSPNFPLPPSSQSMSPGGINVNVVPLNKVASQYMERREYRSEEEGSHYQITLRYIRLT
ncbi:Ig-like domain-containing protein [Alkalihalobacterium elongatum]|uniref:Ig-like domain-containing protein n=1 Tax=Alkalihalobacterium elongatum TaxID=2675466 RepID=UPI001C1F55B7|nr:Ig-like domain-containing protein [Alkalihalobacterium elongatum]